MGYEYLLQALENFVQLVNVGKDIVGLALGLVDHGDDVVGVGDGRDAVSS